MSTMDFYMIMNRPNLTVQLIVWLLWKRNSALQFDSYIFESVVDVSYETYVYLLRSRVWNVCPDLPRGRIIAEKNPQTLIACSFQFVYIVLFAI